MKMRRHNPRPQRQHPNISTAELVAQGIGETLLQHFVGVVDGFAWERRSLQGGGGSDVQDCTLAAGGVVRVYHGAVEDRVRGVHVAGNVGAVHCLDVCGFEEVEGGWGAEGEAGLGCVCQRRVCPFNVTWHDLHC